MKSRNPLQMLDRHLPSPQIQGTKGLQCSSTWGVRVLREGAAARRLVTGLYSLGRSTASQARRNTRSLSSTLSSKAARKLPALAPLTPGRRACRATTVRHVWQERSSFAGHPQYRLHLGGMTNACMVPEVSRPRVLLLTRGA